VNELNPLTLPLQGRQLIEASAGTGKTYNITKIYVRLLLESKLDVQNILVMTFTNAATQELRLRLDAELRLALKQWQFPDQITDPFYLEITRQYDHKTATLCLNLALQNLDQAAVYTIHGFCKRVLADQAFESKMRFDTQIDTNMAELYLQAVQDWYRNFSADPEFQLLVDQWPDPDSFFGQFASAIKDSLPVQSPKIEAGSMPDWRSSWPTESSAFETAQISKRRSVPIKAYWQEYLDALVSLAHTTGETTADEMTLFGQLANEKDFNGKGTQYPMLLTACQFAAKQNQWAQAHRIVKVIDWCQTRVRDMKIQRNAMDFDDLIVNLQHHLATSENNQLARVLACQYPVGLIDEFQDTDAQQYQILEHIYSNEQAQLLVMIGDPKQAIYAFRGGDIFTYLAARQSADHIWAMGTNYRSTQGVIDGYNHLFSMTDPSSFDFDIEYQSVSTGKKDAAELDDATLSAAFQWVFFESEPGLKSLNKEGMNDLANWTSQEIHRLVADVRIGSQPVSTKDIAILVRTGAEAGLMRRSLADHGLDSVYLSNRENLWQSTEASQLLLVLKGIQKPENNRLMVAALSTHWFSLTPVQLYQLSEDDQFHAKWYQRLTELHQFWQQHGLLSMAYKILNSSYLPFEQSRERMLTNDIHLLESIQEASSQLSDTLEVVQWVEQQVQLQSGEYEVRLESDADLIKIVTMHGSKGLEYPIVFLPFVSYGSAGKPRNMIRIHDEQTKESLRVVLPDALQRERETREQRAEMVRLLYVAATRGVNRTYLLAAPFKEFKSSVLGLTTHCDDISGLVIPEHSKVTHSLPVEGSKTSHLNPSDSSTGSVREFFGKIERDWWLSSFTGLTRNLRHDGLSTPDYDLDANRDPSVAVTSEESDARFLLTKGAASGNFMHWLLEEISFDGFSVNQWADKCRRRFPNIMTSSFNDETESLFWNWVEDILATPLNDSGLCLKTLQPEQCLKETEFYYPMMPMTQQSSLISQLLGAHRNEPIQFPSHHKLKGMMHGFVDLIFEWQGKYYVCDYKSNWLGDRLGDYHEQALTEAVQNSFYDLQYWIYSLALHRYLRVHLADYQPEKHLGGVYYLFLRGMKPGSNTGVYHRVLDIEWLERLDQVFAGESREVAP